MRPRQGAGVRRRWRGRAATMPVRRPDRLIYILISMYIKNGNPWNRRGRTTTSRSSNAGGKPRFCGPCQVSGSRQGARHRCVQRARAWLRCLTPCGSQTPGLLGRPSLGPERIQPSPGAAGRAGAACRAAGQPAQQAEGAWMRPSPAHVRCPRPPGRPGTTQERASRHPRSHNPGSPQTHTHTQTRAPKPPGLRPNPPLAPHPYPRYNLKRTTAPVPDPTRPGFTRVGARNWPGHPRPSE